MAKFKNLFLIFGAILMISLVSALDYDTCSRADINSDGKVDFEDFVLVSQNFGKNCSIDNCNNADIDNNGLVDSSDLSYIQEYYGKICLSLQPIEEPTKVIPPQSPAPEPQPDGGGCITTWECKDGIAVKSEWKNPALIKFNESAYNIGFRNVDGKYCYADLETKPTCFNIPYANITFEKPTCNKTNGDVCYTLQEQNATNLPADNLSLQSLIKYSYLNAIDKIIIFLGERRII